MRTSRARSGRAVSVLLTAVGCVLALAGEARAKAIASAPALTEYSCEYPGDGPALLPLPYDDPFGCLQWHMALGEEATAGVADAWESVASAPPVTVAIVDSGIDLTHPDLAPQLWTNPADGTHGFDVVRNTRNPVDRDGHGTEVAGVLAAASDNGTGVAGICPTCRVMPVVAFHEGTNTRQDLVLAGIDVAIQNGAKVVNLSLGGTALSQDKFREKFLNHPSVTFVMAAGNNRRSNDDVPMAPCSAAVLVANALCVAASDQSDSLAHFSNWGSGVKIAAPGEDVFTTILDDDDEKYGYRNGTSLSSPLVAGAAAVLRGYGASARQSVQAILQGAVTGVRGKHMLPRLSLSGALAKFAEMGYDVDPEPPTPGDGEKPGDGDHGPRAGGDDRQNTDPWHGGPPTVDLPERNPRRLTFRTPSWSKGYLRVPYRCTAKCSLTVRVYNGKRRLLSKQIVLPRAASKTLSVKMSKRSYQRIRKLKPQAFGTGSNYTTTTRKPKRLRR